MLIGVGQKLVLGDEAGHVWRQHGQLVVGEAVELLPGQILDSLASQPLHGVVLDLRQLAWRQCAGQPPRGEEVGAGPGVGGAVQGGQHGGQV